MQNRSQLLLSILTLLVSAVTAIAQTETSDTPVKQTQNAERRVVYTGKLLGHFRVPSQQDANVNRCPALGKTFGGASDAAVDFLKRREAEPSVTLVGTGDNFAPQFEARTFYPVPTPKNRAPGKYPYGNKELFYWDSEAKEWVDYDKAPSSLKQQLREGKGTIPNDNVGCFLAAAKYAAIVPGKHDFFFGADRVRLLARFLASVEDANGYKPVQMLGANLVMSTSEIKSATLLPREKKKPWWFDTKWPEAFPVLNLKDGGTVYPWFSYVKVKLADLKLDEKQTADLKAWIVEQAAPGTPGGLVSEEALRKHLAAQPEPFVTLERTLGTAIKKFENIALYRCPSRDASNNPGEPNDVLDPRNKGCTQLTKKQIGLFGNALAYFVEVPSETTGKNGHFSTVEPGRNYGLCSVSGANASCLRFSVHRPFFYHPHDAPESTNKFIDPDPYVLTEDKIAIFGVVEPDLSEHVGVLNFGWQHAQDELKTVVSAQDPAEALRQQLDYFERRCREDEKCNFSGLKVLLAQMSPQRARVLGARLPEFQLIVTAADAEQGTTQTELKSVWTPKSRAGSFVAVPMPGFNRVAKSPEVHFGEVTASLKDDSWTLISKINDPRTIEDLSQATGLTNFWKQVTDALARCVPSRLAESLTPNEDLNSERLKLLTLCALREKLGADVALVQKRDFFDVLPKNKADIPENTQEFLDRLIWKGDLLTLMFVRGSALKQALKDSKKFTAEDSSVLSLADERSRQLEMLGIEEDKDTGEYLIKELPIEDGKTYTVATTDYIGVGDTGYRALADAALNPRTHPAAFPNTLNTLSGTVCRKMFANPIEADKYCLDEINRVEYLDETVASLVPTQRPPGFFQKTRDNFLLKFPPKDKFATDVAGGIEEMTQRRPFWVLSVKNLSFGFTHLSNTLTDFELDNNFAGVSNTALQAHKNNSLTIGAKARLSHFTHKREYFLEGGIDLKRDSKGISNDEPLITQTVNKMFVDPGVTVRFPGKSLPHWGLVLSVHFEAPLLKPETNYTLSTMKVIDAVNNITVNDRLDVSQPRSIQILPRVALRIQNKDSFVEFGPQAGYEMRALQGYRFNTPGVLVPAECLLNAEKSLTKCITEKSKDTDGSITKDSDPSAIVQNRKRMGLYWKIGFSLPLGEKLKYELEDEGNWFLARFHEDNSIDTRLLDVNKHRVRFFIWPNFSIGPTYQLLFYRNKGTNPDWLTQRQLTIEAVINFDLFNRRERQIQIRNKP